MAPSRADTYWNSEARTGSAMALGSVDKQGISAEQLGSGKAMHGIASEQEGERDEQTIV